jgi:hypothetical protein
MYRLGWNFAPLLAKLGVPLLIKVDIIYDDEANVYIATSTDLTGLVVEADSLDELEKEVLELAPELLILTKPELCNKKTTHLAFSQQPVAI